MNLDYAVAAETGAFMHCVGALEIDGADLLHLSVELLEKRGSEISRKYPNNLSHKLKSLPKLVQSLRLEIDSNLAVLNHNRTNEVLGLRNTLAHSKIVELSGTPHDFRIRYVKMSLPEELPHEDGLQKVTREEGHLESEELREKCSECMQMIGEVEQIRVKVWQLFQGWPNYLVDQKTSAIKPSEIIKHHASAWPQSTNSENR